jgi:aconitase B
MGSLPADQEQFMMIEDLYKSVDRLNKAIEDGMHNKVNIEFLQKQVEKAIIDIEDLKDANREIVYKNGNGH